MRKPRGPAPEPEAADQPVPAAKRKGSRKSVNAGNLADLPAARLAEILMAVAEQDAAVKRRLRLELAAEAGAEHLAVEIGKQMATLEGRQSRIPWRRYKAFVRDLDLLRIMAGPRLTALSPALSLELGWRFNALAPAALSRTKDERGEVEAVFREAIDDLAAASARAPAQPMALAKRMSRAVQDGAPQLAAPLIAALTPRLDAKGLAELRAQLEASHTASRRPRAHIRAALQGLADAAGDVDAYIATFDEADRTQPWTAAQIAARLIAAGRRDEARAALERGAPPGYRAGAAPDRWVSPLGRPPGLYLWERAFADLAEASGDLDLAQAVRWRAFELRLEPTALRAYLKPLGDFDDVVAEDRAMEAARAHPDAALALRFLVEWPALNDAARLVLDRHRQIEAGDAELILAAAQALDARHPLSAVLLRRLLIEHAFRRRFESRQAIAERELAEIAALEPRITDWKDVEAQPAFIDRVTRTWR